VIRVSGAELRYQLAIRGWDRGALARESGVSEATISRAMAGRGIRRLGAMRLAQGLRRGQPVPELLALVSLPDKVPIDG
jgi:hypothetical protein